VRDSSQRGHDRAKLTGGRDRPSPRLADQAVLPHSDVRRPAAGALEPLSSRPRLLIRHGCPLLILLFLVLFTFWHAFDIRPLHGDNLSILSWAARSDATSFVRGNPLSYPEWRPLAYLTVWAQYKVAGIRQMESYFAFNIVVWLSCAYCFYAFVYQTSQSRLSALAAAAAMVSDERAVEAIKWITGRQTTLACLFGFSALLLACQSSLRGWISPRSGVIFVLLTAAALSKEYGLAFSGALAVWSFLGGSADRRKLAGVALAAVTTYSILRLAIVAGAGGNYCNEMGFFGDVRNLCYHEVDASVRLAQHVYNVAATFVGILSPGFFASNGRVNIDPAQLAVSLIWLLLAVVGWTKTPRLTRVMLLLICFNALLSYVVYRSRDQIIGMMGLYATAGVGLGYAWSFIRPRMGPQWLPLAAAAFVFWLPLQQALVVRQLFEREVAAMLRQDPCASLANPARYDRQLVQQIKRQYGMSNPDCGQ
jgi:hypothetical protein